MSQASATTKPGAQTKPAALKETIVTSDGQVVQITTKPVSTPRGLPNHTVSARTRKRHKLAVAALAEPDELVKEQVGGFVKFVREHAIVGLAVGFIIATQAQAVIKQVVVSFIDPIIKLFIGTGLDKFVLPAKMFGHQASFEIGMMIYSLINLFAVLVAIYILIKVLKLDKLDKES